MLVCQDISLAVCFETKPDIFDETWGHFPAFLSIFLRRCLDNLQPG